MPQRARLVLFSLLMTAALLYALNLGIEALERRGLVTTRRPDDVVRYLDAEIFQVDPDGWVTTTPFAHQSVVPARFRLDRGDTWRIFILGESFAQGSPYTMQQHGREEPGGISTWLRLDLAARYPGASIEVINLATGGQNSHRVRRMAEMAVHFDPSVIFVATCNNEGVLPPSRVAEALHKLGGYRLLTTLLSPPRPAEVRPLFTLQDADLDAVEAAFRENLAAIREAGRAVGVPVLMATLPVNRRYTGAMPGHVLGAAGPQLAQAEAMRPPDPCVAAGRALLEAGHPAEALAALATCEADVGDALRWSGLAHLALGDTAAARRTLDQSIELKPLNRCRPSFNQAIREAAAAPGAHLVDLQAVADAQFPDGLAGEPLFYDNCHLRWQGYALMAEALLREIEAAGLGPPGPPVEAPPPDRAAQARALHLQEPAPEPPP